MKKTVLVLLWLLLSLILPACASRMTYEELSIEAERTGDNTKVKRFERLANKAVLHFENKAACMAIGDAMWFCRNGAATKEQRRNQPPKSIETIVRDYRKERSSRCGCVSRRALRDVFDHARRGW